MTKNTQELSDQGVSIWLDDLSRTRLTSGGLQKLIDDDNVVGVTTNPTIFAAALAKGEAYDEQVRELAAAGKGVDDAIFEITTKDVADACDLFRPVYDKTNGFDGRVSIEVSPYLANDTEATASEAERLWKSIDKENLLIKIPATKEGLTAIAGTIAKGISVNVTLIFSLERYREVINAYLTGLERAKEAGLDLSKIHSVASFFVSRVDTEVDKQLEAKGTDEAKALLHTAGIANARLAYQIYEEAFSSERAKLLLEAGANKQRPLWASTGVKDPSLAATLYVVELVAPETVNTMPEKTLQAVIDEGGVKGNTIEGTYEKSQRELDALDAQGVSYQKVVETLEDEGVDKFKKSWDELTETVSKALEAAK